MKMQTDNCNSNSNFNCNCTVCCEKFNKVLRKVVLCDHCGYTCCSVCCRTYLLDSPNDAHCMQCRVGWTKSFMYSNFPIHWIKQTYDKSRNTIFFEKVKARIPEVQLVHHEYIRERMQYKRYHLLLEERKFTLDMDLHEKYTDEMNRIGRQYPEIFMQNEHEPNYYDYYDELIRARTRARSPAPSITPSKKVVCGCPSEDCKGYVYAPNYQCTVCAASICQHCHEKQDHSSQHACKPDNIESVRMLKQTTKPCIKCNVPIFKIDGCDQMWCTICHTAFSWTTGKEEFHIHNPHAYEYYRTVRTNLPPGPIRAAGMHCFGELTMFDVRLRFVTENPNYDLANFPAWIENLSRCKIHIREVTVREMQSFIDTKDIIMAMDIIKYTCNEITGDDLEKLVIKRKSILERFECYLGILHTFNIVVNDLFDRLTITNLQIVFKECKNFIKHMNDAFIECETYSKKKPLIHIDQWLFYVQERNELIGMVDWINGERLYRL